MNNNSFFRADKRICFITIVLVFCVLLLYVVSGKFLFIHQSNREYVSNYYTSTKVIDQVARIKNHNTIPHIVNVYTNMDAVSDFDKKLYKICVNTYFNNSILFAAFIMIMIYMLFNILGSNRRRYFEETYFIHILILMNYIHKMDGERGIILPTFI